MSGDERTDDNLPADGTAGAASLDDLVGAYLLDALDPAERAAFEAHLLDSAAARDEVALLRPVVQVLPLALEDADDELAITPSLGLRSRILLAARNDDEREEYSDEPGPTGGTAPVPIGRGARTRSSGAARPGGILDLVRRIGIERIAAGLLALVAASAIIWAVALQGRLNDREEQLDDLRSAASVIAYSFSPTTDGPPQAGGALSIVPEDPDHAELNLVNLPAPNDGQTYQAWFLDLDETGTPIAARPGVTFAPEEDGTVRLSDVEFDQPFDAVGITIEPAGGSESPTLPVILLGTRSFAQG